MAVMNRTDIENGYDPIVLAQEFSRQFTSDYLAKNALHAAKTKKIHTESQRHSARLLLSAVIGIFE